MHKKVSRNANVIDPTAHDCVELGGEKYRCIRTASNVEPMAMRVERKRPAQ